MNTVDPEEIERFSRIAEEWWNPRGKFRPLHAMNPVRIDYILAQAGGVAGKRLLDIGCGGGLIAEPMARLGAQVTAIDASGKNIAVAGAHAKNSGVEVDYRATSAEALLAAGNAGAFDVVLALEIVEHVADVGAFMHAAFALAKPGGALVFSTLNRTAKSYALAIFGAEYVLRLLPRGTHDWRKFLKPSELAAHIRACGGGMQDMRGIAYNPLSGECRLTADVSVNYLMTAAKPG